MDSSQPPLRFARIASSMCALALLAAPAWADAAGASSGAEAMNVPLNLAIIAFLVLANGFFVASEFALVAVRKTRIDQLAAEGSGAAKVVQGALRDLDRYIAATQVGITIASLILGGVGEKTFHHLFEPYFGWVPAGLPAGITGSFIAIALAYFVMTVLHVIIGELMPKSVALQLSEKTTLVVARPLVIFAKLFSPLIWLLNGTGGFLLKRVGIHPAEGHGTVHSSEEIGLLVRESHEGGELNDTEAEILHRVVRFSDLTIREVMVPRVEMQGLPVEMPSIALRAWIHSRPHSRVPVYVGSLDEVIGVVHLKDLVSFAAKLGKGRGGEYDAADEAPTSLMPIVREALRLPETATVDKLLVEFKRSRQQMAIVIDEFGGTAGLVTLGDLLEQVFGEVSDEFDAQEPQIESHADGRVTLPGRTLIDEVNQRFETGFRQDDADTIAGLLLSALGRAAKEGDEAEINGHLLRVEATERLRITKVSLRLASHAETVEVSA